MSSQENVEIYQSICQSNNITPNSQLLEYFKENPYKLPEIIDMSRNYLGPRGSIAFIQTLQDHFEVKRVILKDIGMRNQAVKELAEIFGNLDQLEEVDVSYNFVSTGAGQALERLLRKNGSIKRVNVEGTKIDPEIRLKLNEILTERQQ